jgi:Na+/H+ antiporter
MAAELLAVLLGAVVLSAVTRRYNQSSPLVLVVAGLAVTLIPGFPDVDLDPDLVLFVVLPPLLWSAGLESSYVSLRRSFAPISALAVGLPLATTFAVGFVAYRTVPELTLAAALVLGAVVAPPDAVSAAAVGRKVGLSRRTMTLLGGESLLNDATALTAYKVTLGAAIGMAESFGHAAGVFVWAVVGGVAVGWVTGHLIVWFRGWLDDSVAESAIGLLAPFVLYFVTEEIGGSGVLAVVVAALVLGHRSTEAGYATRLQDDAVWRAVQLMLESFAFLLIGLQLPQVVTGMHGVPFVTIAVSSVAVFATVLVVRIAWVFGFTYLVPHPQREKPTAAGTLVVAWAGMRGVVSLAAAFGIPLTTLSGADFPGRSHIIFLTFVVVVGTLLLHGLTLPWLIRRLGVGGDAEAHSDALAIVAVRTRAATAAEHRLDERLARARASGKPMEAYEQAAKVLREWNRRRRDEAWDDRLGRRDEEMGPAPAAVFRRLRLDMLAAERETFIAERDADRIDDEVLRRLMRDLDLQEATLNR